LNPWTIEPSDYRSVTESGTKKNYLSCNWVIFCHNLYLSATLKQFLAEFAARYHPPFSNFLQQLKKKKKKRGGGRSPIIFVKHCETGATCSASEAQSTLSNI
jgi:hypothetical protein